MNVKADVSALYRLGPFVRPAMNRVAYVGPGRSTNLGDRCMLQAYQKLLPDFEFAVVPPGDPARRLQILDRLSRGRTVGAIALGGGTLIGSPKYRLQLEKLTGVFPDRPLFMFGVGVEDPVKIGERRMTTLEELRRWAELLERFSSVHVRGPRSQEILTEVGVESAVVGDSALALGDVTPSQDYEQRLLGLNVGVSNPIWGGDPQRVHDEVVQMGKTLVAKGWRIRLLPVWPTDLRYTHSVAGAIGSNVEVREHFGDVASFLESTRECDVFVGEKLHSVVLASTVFVPSLMLEYRPKCLDFQRSIARADYAIRTDEVHAAVLVDRVEEISERRAVHQSAITDRVSALRSSLSLAAEITNLRLHEANR